MQFRAVRSPLKATVVAFSMSQIHERIRQELNKLIDEQEKLLSWCEQKETGLCDQKENIELSPLPREQRLVASQVASAEDRALRGRNLSAV